jgi:hydrogenase maturation protease
VLSAVIGNLARDIDGVSDIRVHYEEAVPKDMNSVKQVIAVMSGKGGVGKSLVTALTAVALRRAGHEVGILDADITGPSIPKMFGITGRPIGDQTGFMPVPSRSGIEVMSINLILPGEDDAVIWRGPLIARMITQFWEEVLWGKLDYLIVDLPPGTADAPLTVLQSLPVSGIIIVFTPQDLTQMVVRKAVNMARQMEKPILGVVENMSYLVLPETGKRLEIFGKSRGEEMAKAADAPLLSSFPLDPTLATLCDAGKIEQYCEPPLDQFSRSLNEALQESNPSRLSTS